MDEQVKEFVKTEAKAEDLKEFYRKFGQDENGIDAFFLEIIRTIKTTKVGNLNEDELGKPQIPVRTLLELSKDCALIPSMSSFQKSFEIEAENILATSLSKDGFLIKARITQKKEFLDKPKKKVRKGLFGKKVEEDEE